MPAAAVIPAPLAYVKVAAVKTLVVGILKGRKEVKKWFFPFFGFFFSLLKLFW